MERYISKDTLVMELERRIGSCAKQREDMLNVQCRTLADDAFARMCELRCFKDFLDTLEVKEVNLDVISRHYALNNSPWDDCRDEIQDAYKAGFELGMQVSSKAHKGE